MPSPPEIEARIRQIGREIFERARAAEPTIFQLAWWEQRILDWTTGDEALRIQLFRFVDVLPSLKTASQIAEHLTEYLGVEGLQLPGPIELALRFGSPTSVAGRVAAVATRRNVRRMARRFIAGENLPEAISAVRRLRDHSMGFTIDLLGEATNSDPQADRYAQRITALIEALAEESLAWEPNAQIDAGPAGAVARTNVSIKLSSLDSQFDAIDPVRTTEAVGGRLRPILRHARRLGASVNIDMEQYDYKDLTLQIFKSILNEDEFRDFTGVGVVIQTYLKDSERDLMDLIEWTRARGRPISVRLVKGAYWDYEIVRAVQRGWPCPVFTQKWESDARFERLLVRLLENQEWIRPAIASHNVRSLATAIALAERLGLSKQDYEIQMLYGMGDPIKTALLERGLRLRIYTPYGPLIPGMGYLIRRLLENTSNQSFLRQSITEHLPVEELLANPERSRPASPPVPEPISIDPMENGLMNAFKSEPATDFSVEENRAAMAAAIDEVHAAGGAEYPLVIGSEKIELSRKIESIDPSDKAFVVGRVSCAGVEEADRAVEAARRAWPAWRALGAEGRAAILKALAAAMRRRRFELSATMVLESGKPWREADGDVVEAIDFCEFYSDEMVRLAGRPRRRHFPGEENTLVYEPCGVALIIAPWNFPLAILTGMMSAALVAGNTVIVKPSLQSPVIAAKLFEMLAEAGLPEGVANFLPGIGKEVGAHLVAHRDVDLIAFTGSRAVGLHILETASKTAPGQRSVKRVIAEMGGKNAMIIDSDADLDEAVSAVAASAFGYAGQKCSACSRAIVLSSVHDAFRERIVDAARSLIVGAAREPATMIGPLIDEKAFARVRSYIERGKSIAELICEVDPPSDDGYFVGPAIFDHVEPRSILGQEEIFGPVLALMEAADLDEAIAIANDTDYALTGGIFSRSPAHIDQARAEVRVGNFYINRSITGALVDRQPFGGFKMSGIGSKAGGPDYLPQFCQPKTITENTLRHGFAPPEGRPEAHAESGG